MGLQDFSKGKTNMDITKEDLNRIYDRFDPLIESVASIKTTLKLLVHKSPCTNLNEHLTSHRLDKRDWKRAIISGAVDLGKMGAVAAVTYFIMRANGGS